ncbi:MAG TPA: efflux RND transporter periplasmic adaptor subunit [Anaerolineae bacterium]|nr:efflux RND transporter periplasmic adaptor subunit [Anaerolineae bacterium]HQH38132.1 efflux RND transporter periplasmic adaptor subunit [Anaerolineae bacterium]
MRKVLTWIIILALIGGGVAAYFWWRHQQATAVQSQSILRTEQIVRGDLPIAVVASGNVTVNKKLDVRFNTAGSVSRIYVKVNQRVKAGEALAQLSTTDLEHAVQQAEIALEQATLNRDILIKPATADDLELAKLNVQSAAQALEAARLGKQTAQVDADAMIVQAQRTRENTFKDWRSREGTEGEENARTLYENAEEQERIARINAEVTIKQAQAQWLTAYTRYRQAVESLHQLEQGPTAEQMRQAELQIEQAQLNLEQAQERLADARLTAPFAGLITAVNIQENLQVLPGVAAFTLIDDAQFYVEVTVDEIDIGKVRVGQAADITLDAYPQDTLTGAVERITPAALDVGGVMAYQLRVHLTSPSVTPAAGGEKGRMIRDGMTASIVIHTDLIKDILLAPNWAVRTDQSSGEAVLYCYVLGGGGVLERRDITRGRYNDTYTEVLSGLNEGDTVVLIAEERTLLDFSTVGQ